MVASPAKVAFPCLGRSRQGVGVLPVDFLADVDGPSLVDKAGVHSIATNDHIEL